jgi:phytoene dehydrogenase-like protein
VAPPAGAQSETVHYGGAHEEIVRSEADTAAGRIADTPFAVLAQQSLFDSKRAPAGRSHGGAYGHVSHGSDVDMTSHMERKIRRLIAQRNDDADLPGPSQWYRCSRHGHP